MKKIKLSGLVEASELLKQATLLSTQIIGIVFSINAYLDKELLILVFFGLGAILSTILLESQKILEAIEKDKTTHFTINLINDEERN